MCRLPDTILEEEPNWALLEMDAMKVFRRTPDYSTFLGRVEPPLYRTPFIATSDILQQAFPPIPHFYIVAN